MIGGVWMWVVTGLYGISLFGLTAPMMVAVSGAGWMINAGISVTMTPFRPIAATAFACIGFFKFSIAALCGAWIVTWPVSPLPLAVMMTLMGALCVCISGLKTVQQPIEGA